VKITMKFKDMLAQELDVDITNDYVENETCALVCPVRITDLAKERFKDLMDLDVCIDGSCAEFQIKNAADPDGLAQQIDRFVYIAAGFCSVGMYKDYIVCEGD